MRFPSVTAGVFTLCLVPLLVSGLSEVAVSTRMILTFVSEKTG